MNSFFVSLANIGISKLVSKHGGFTATSSEKNIMIAQVQLVQVPDILWAKENVLYRRNLTVYFSCIFELSLYYIRAHVYRAD